MTAFYSLYTLYLNRNTATPHQYDTLTFRIYTAKVHLLHTLRLKVNTSINL